MITLTFYKQEELVKHRDEVDQLKTRQEKLDRRLCITELKGLMKKDPIVSGYQRARSAGRAI